MRDCNNVEAEKKLSDDKHFVCPQARDPVVDANVRAQLEAQLRKVRGGDEPARVSGTKLRC